MSSAFCSKAYALLLVCLAFGAVPYARAQEGKIFEPLFERAIKTAAREPWEIRAAAESARRALTQSANESNGAVERVADAVRARTAHLETGAIFRERADGNFQRYLQDTPEARQDAWFRSIARDSQKTEFVRVGNDASDVRGKASLHDELVKEGVGTTKTSSTRELRLVSDASRLLEERDLALAASSPPVVLYKKSKPARTETEIAAVLSQPIRRIRLLHSLPQTVREAEFVHPGLGRQFASSSWRAISRDLRATHIPISTPELDSGETAATEMVKLVVSAAPDELLLLAGHVEDGRVMMRDGSSLSVAELSRLAQSPIVFVGCNTLNYVEVAAATAHAGNVVVGTGRYISYPELVNIVRVVARQFRAHPHESLGDILKRFQLSRTLKVFMGVVELFKHPSSPKPLFLWSVA